MLAFLALSLLVVVCYLPAMLWGGFVWDDIDFVKSEPVRDVSGLWQIWFSPSNIEGEGHYWPLVYTTFWLEHKLWGFDPTGYHIVNVLLHLRIHCFCGIWCGGWQCPARGWWLRCLPCIRYTWSRWLGSLSARMCFQVCFTLQRHWRGCALWSSRVRGTTQDRWRCMRRVF